MWSSRKTVIMVTTLWKLPNASLRSTAINSCIWDEQERLHEFRTIALKEKEHLDVKVMIGGAVTTQSFADEIGADGYSADAADAVRLAKKLLAE